MLLRLGFIGALLTTTTTILASAVDRELVGIQCRCLSLSIQTTPSACTTLGFQKYHWSAAQFLASEHNLKLEFASQTTIDKVLSIDRPLPTSALQAISYGEADLVPSKGKETEDKMICGYGHEVRNMSGYGTKEPQSHEVGHVISVFILLVVAYVVGEYLWTRHQEGNIKLVGEERDLTSMANAESTTPSSILHGFASIKEGKNFAAPSNFS